MTYNLSLGWVVSTPKIVGVLDRQTPFKFNPFKFKIFTKHTYLHLKYFPCPFTVVSGNNWSMNLNKIRFLQTMKVPWYWTEQDCLWNSLHCIFTRNQPECMNSHRLVYCHLLAWLELKLIGNHFQLHFY